MSENNLNNEYVQPQKKNKSHTGLIILLCAVISLICGFGGSWLAYNHFNSSTNIKYSSEKGTSEAATASKNKTGKTVSEVASIATPSVVEIVTKATSEEDSFFGQSIVSESAGSGVIISSDGYIITNNHVVENANTIKVTTYNGKSYKAQLVGADKMSDIAVLKVDATKLTAATIGNSSKIATGDTAVVIGNPLGTLGGTVTSGIISATSRELVINNESMNLIQTNAEINSGNSGGGLFDGNGHLIGIVNAKDSGTTSSGSTIEGIGFAIPINTAMDVADQLMKNGVVTNRATLGVTLQEVTVDTPHYKAGLYITKVLANGAAKKAGLQAYDRIVEADGNKINSYTDLTKILQKKKVGEQIKLVIDRDGNEKTITVTLSASGKNQ